MSPILHAMGKVKPEPADIGKKTVVLCKDGKCITKRQKKRPTKVIRQLILTELSHGETSVAILSNVANTQGNVIRRHLDILEAQGVVMRKEGRSAYNRKEIKYYLAA